MSYINDALRKAQKENQIDSAYLNNVLPPGANESKKSLVRIGVAGLVVVLLLAGVALAAFYWKSEKRAPMRVVAVTVPNVSKNIVKPDPSVLPPAPPPVPLSSAPAALPASPKMPEASAPVAAQNVPPMDKPREAPPNGLETGEKQMEKAPLKGDKKVQAKKQPDNPKTLYVQALKKQKEGRMEEAEVLYEQILKIQPRHLAAVNNLGVVYMQQNKYKEAIARFNEAIAIKHDYVDGHYNLACLYAKKNDTKQSLFYLKNAIDFNPEVKGWAENDDDLRKLASLPEFQKLLQKQDN